MLVAVKTDVVMTGFDCISINIVYISPSFIFRLTVPQLESLV